MENRKVVSEFRLETFTTLATWKDTIAGLIESHGEDAVLYADTLGSDWSFVVEKLNEKTDES